MTTLRPGRPRDPQLDASVLTAALEQLVEVGFARLTMKAIATRAGVSRTSVYRRWTTTTELVIEALRRRTEVARLPLVAAGNVRGDLRALLLLSVRANSADLQLGYALATEVFANPELGRAYRRDVAGPMLRPLRDLVERGVESGELPADSDVDLLTDLVPGLCMQRILVGKPLDESFVERLLDQFFPETASRDAHSVPAAGGTHPSSPRDVDATGPAP